MKNPHGNHYKVYTGSHAAPPADNGGNKPPKDKKKVKPDKPESKPAKAKKTRKPLNPKIARLKFHTAPFFYGAFFGIATAVYGFGGAALLCAFGCYEKACGLFRFLFNKNNDTVPDTPAVRRARIRRLLLFITGAVAGFATLGVIIAAATDGQPVLTRMFYIGIILGGIPTVLQNGAVTERLRGRGWILCVAMVGAAVIFVSGGGGGRYEFKQTRTGSTAVAELKNTGNLTIARWYLKVRGGTCGAVNGADMTRFDTISDKFLSLYGMGADENSANALTGGNLTGGQTTRIQYKITDNKLMDLVPVVVSDSGADIMWLVITSFAAGVLIFLPGIPFTVLLAFAGSYGVLAAAASDGKYGVVAAAAVCGVFGMLCGGKWASVMLNRAAYYGAMLGGLIGSVIVAFPDGIDLNTEFLLGLVLATSGSSISLYIGAIARDDAECEDFMLNGDGV